MKKLSFLFTRVIVALCFVFGISSWTVAQESVEIIDLHGMAEGLSPNVFPTDMIVYQGELYIGMSDQQGSAGVETELVKFNGTEAEIVDLGPYSVGSFAYFCVHNNELYFRLLNGQLGKYDGSAFTEIDLTSMNPEVDDPAMPGHMCSYNGALYFKVAGLMNQPGSGLDYEPIGEPLAKYDGSTVTVFDMSAINDELQWDCEPNSLTVYNGLLYGQYDFQYLVAFDGNATADIIPFANEEFLIGWKGYLNVYGANLYLRTQEYEGEMDPVGGYSTLGKYDGINPVSIIDLNQLNADVAQDNWPGYMENHNGKMFFKTNDIGRNQVLASFDGSSVEIHDLSNLNEEILYSVRPAAITSYNGNLYFRGSTQNGEARAASDKLVRFIHAPAPVPIGNWAVLFAVLLISTFVVIRVIKR